MQLLSLNGSQWRFRDCSGKSWLPASVPGCVHTDLLRTKKIPDPFWGDNEKDLQWIEERDWEYRILFRVNAAMLNEEVVELVADGLDTVATITLNGVKIAQTDNMFTGWRWDVKRFLNPKKANVLAIRFGSAMRYIRENRTSHTPREINDPVGGCTRIRKQQCQFGWDWGPRFVSAGIWRDIRIEGWTGNRLEGVRVTQRHEGDFSRTTLSLAVELARPDANAKPDWQLSLNGDAVAIGTGNEIVVEKPKLWWPNGQGSQPLYTLEVKVPGIGSWSRKIGLRTIMLDRTTDQWGEAFRFIVNGRAIFAKGANWIPAHSFVTTLARKDYARDLRAAQEAHMNMVRVWGGGIYESEDFYDECDARGLLVWQDFMFACTMYPGDDAFVEIVREEAQQQIKRLRHRACLALWCGNNEVWAINAHDLIKPEFASYRTAYERVFHEALPPLVAKYDGVTAYWPSSPWRGDIAVDHPAGEMRGDTHFWDVWHAQRPVSDYEKWAFRFVAEFGMQSYSSPETNATFAAPKDSNVFGPVMKNHQKNRAGNHLILDYVSRLYRFPHSQDALIYLSQLNQAYCMQTGVEHYRRNMPRCMGALYWQLNDCWPVASWSSIEFTGRWKALHYIARRFFAPMIASAHVTGEESSTIGNYRVSTVNGLRLFTVSDNPAQTRGVLRWDIFHVSGRVIARGKKAVVLRHGESVQQHTLDLTKQIKRFGRNSLFVRLALDAGGACTSEDTAFLSPPRYIELPKATHKTKVTAKWISTNEALITFVSAVFQHRFAFEIEGLVASTELEVSDNYFELYPGEKKSVTVRFKKPVTRAKRHQLTKKILHRSLADTYE